MKRGVLVLVLSMMLGGCALPLGVQVASWALDGISYVATKKSMTDHGLSIVTQQDCAMWRIMKQEEICAKYEDSTTAIAAKLDDEDDNFEHQISDQAILVASNETKTTAVKPIGPIKIPSKTDDLFDLVDIEKLANFETASGGSMTQKSLVSAEKSPFSAIKTANYTSKKNKNIKITGYSVGIYSSALVQLRSRSHKIHDFIVKPQKAKLATNIDYLPEKSVRNTFKSLKGYSAASISSAWAVKKGQVEPKIQWVFAASPAPQQNQDLSSEYTEIALTEDSEAIEAFDNDQVQINEPPNTPDMTTLDEEFQTSELKPALINPTILQKNSDIATKSHTVAVSQATKTVVSRTKTTNTDSQEDLYFVIASFNDTNSAHKLQIRYRALDIQLVVGNFDGYRVYRGIVGPYSQVDLPIAQKRIWREGVKNVWAMRLDRSKWNFVYSASVSEELSARHLINRKFYA